MTGSQSLVISRRINAEEGEKHDATEGKKKPNMVYFPVNMGQLLPSEFYSQFREWLSISVPKNKTNQRGREMATEVQLVL